MLFYIIFIWIAVPPNWTFSFCPPGIIIIIFIIMRVACAAAKTENNIYLSQPFSEWLPFNIP